MSEQFELEDFYGARGCGFNHDAREAAIYGIIPFLHRQTAWIWDGRVITKNVGKSVDETTHFELWGDYICFIRFRGWFADGILTVMDRERRVCCADDLPEQLYSHLFRKFKFKVGQIRFP